ncbi:MAG: LacI family DNA-binding transcriptional regulator [Candidatus Izemoplasma sp.]|nr:LacI family DNA-binding transcriptional regulator [Candidatus Izemoplasma sp.]
MKKTIYDIAEELGVAPSTVSKALNNSGGISERMKKRVVDYANKVRYFPNSNASKLKTKTSYTIGVIYSENLGIGLEHHYFSSILQAFKAYVERRGYEISFVITNLGNREMTYLEYCAQKNIDGVFIVTSTATNPNLKELIDSDVACITTDLYHDHLYTVISDNELGAKLAVDHFVDLNHTKIGHIRGSKFSIAGNERYEGYLDAMRRHGLNIDKRFIVTADYYSYESGYQAARKLMALNALPTAIFCASDQIALGAMKAFQEAGIRVPQDISIIGFDDIDFVKYLSPKLTTIRQDTKQIGETAAKKLLIMIDSDKELEEMQIKIPVKLIERESTIKQDK